MLVMLDRITKNMAQASLMDADPFVIIDGVLEFKYLDGGNTGAAWGILEGRTGLFVAVTLIVAALLVYLILRINKIIELSLISRNENVLKRSRRFTAFQIICVFILGGAAGNLIDRAVLGYVIDFIYFKLIDFPIFNVADCYVTVATVLLIICCIFFLDEKEFNLIFSFKKIEA